MGEVTIRAAKVYHAPSRLHDLDAPRSRFPGKQGQARSAPQQLCPNPRCQAGSGQEAELLPTLQRMKWDPHDVVLGIRRRGSHEPRVDSVESRPHRGDGGGDIERFTGQQPHH